MPRKKREIRRDYRQAGFDEEPGKGSHTVYRHPLLKKNYPVAGKDGEDAMRYDEDNLREARELLKKALRKQQEEGKA